jgi:tetratricopeptide (TPR) repeat protein
MTGYRIGRAAVIGAFLLSLLALPVPAQAQSGALKGKVVDAQNKPVRDALVTIQAKETNRKYETKTNSNGEFRQIGLPPGNYAVTAQKDNMSQALDVRVGMGTEELNFALSAASPADAKKEEARRAAIQKLFAEGAELSNAGKHDEAIVKFNEVLTQVPKCAECYANIGATYVMKQDLAAAEDAYKKGIAINPDYIENYNGLVTIYTTQKKYKEAQAISAEAAKRGGGAAGAAGGGNAGALYNQAATMWNAPDADAAAVQAILQSAIKADPKHAEAHFLLGNVLVKLGSTSGDMAKFGEAAAAYETYLKLAPTGPNAAKAKENFEQLKSFKK